MQAGFIQIISSIKFRLDCSSTPTALCWESMRGMSMIVAARHGPAKHLEGSSLSLTACFVAMAFLAVMLTAQKARASWFGRQEQQSVSNDRRGALRPENAVSL